MTVFMCIQKPDSQYNDLHGSAYVYWSTLPNGRRIEEGDWLVLTLTNKTSEGGRKVFGIGQVERIFQSMVEGRELSKAEYARYREFDPPLTYDQIGGDPRTNAQHSMNRIPDPRGEELLDLLLVDGMPDVSSHRGSNHRVIVWDGATEAEFERWLDRQLDEGWAVVGVGFEDSSGLLRRCVFRREGG